MQAYCSLPQLRRVGTVLSFLSREDKALLQQLHDVVSTAGSDDAVDAAATRLQELQL